MTRTDLQTLLDDPEAARLERPLAGRGNPTPTVAYRDEPLRAVVYRMAETGLTRFPVVEGDGSRRLVGMVGLFDLLEGRVRTLEAERRRERVLPLRLFLPRGLLRRRRTRSATGT